VTLEPPYLSIVFTGRNDGYGADFVTRFIRTLEFNHRHLTAAGVAHEFILVEWNPVEDRPWLADIVRAEVAGLGAAFRAYLPDPAYHDALRMNPRLEFLEFPAKNVGVRRARGRFVLTTNCDIYLGRVVIEQLARAALEPGIVYRARRLDLKLGIDQSSVDWDVLEDTRNYGLPRGPLQPPLYTGGTGDFLLLDRESYHALRGFNEVYRVARIGLDFNFVVKAYDAGYRIAEIPGPVYHVNHTGSFRLTRGRFEGREAQAPWGNARWPSRHVVYANPESWGLGFAPERDLGSGRTWLDFDWRAVPPLAELKRITVAAG
jgi:hypothetical protein